MPIWKLTPIDLTDSNWLASSHRDLAIIRAPDETTARTVAEKAFALPLHFTPGSGVRVPPWMRPSLVKAEMIEDRRFDPAGPPEVLMP